MPRADAIPVTTAVGFASRARAYLSVNQAITNATWTKVALDTTSFDGLGEFSLANSRFVATTNGYYLAFGAVQIDAAVDATIGVAALYKDGVSQLLGSYVYNGTAGTVKSVVIDTVYITSAGYIELYAYHNSGVAKNAVSGADGSILFVTRIA